MNLPSRLDLPFFSYGLFRPGQIGYSRLRQHVEAAEPGWATDGQLLERDGLPILDAGGRAGRGLEVGGFLIRFKPGSETEAYKAIAEIEPDALYRWEERQVGRGDQQIPANVLVGKKPQRGSSHLEETTWDWRQDPLFTAAMCVIKDTLEQNKTFDWNLQPFFRLQMGYLLLWSVIERFASFKYHLGSNVTGKIYKLADEPCFVSALQECVSEARVVYRSDDPETKETLDRTRPKKALAYYYQIRSNMTHRGKAAIRDFDMLLKSLSELFDIFSRVLEAEFEAND